MFKNTTPRKLATYVALIVAIVMLLLLILFYSAGMFSMSWWWLIILPLFFFTFIYQLILYILRKYIYQKVKLIYKSIHQLKRKGRKKNIELGSDIFGTVEKEVSDWAASQAKEIESLRSMEEYRRDFLGNISHELKTPIFNIQGYLFTLAEGGIYDEQINLDYLKRALVNVDRLQTIVNDLEIISRLESGKIMLEYRQFDIRDLINECIEDQKMMAKKNGIKLSLKQGADQSFQVFADRENIRQVLNNLISNSIKYGIKNGQTKIGCYNMESYILIEVTDNGIGIEREDLNHVFDRFYRVDKSRSRNMGGSGLGLSIVKHIVDAHKQTISIRSEKGKGSTFGFTLEKA